MQILQGLDGLLRLPAGAVASIGNFDGVHLGHRRILQTAKQLCAASDRAALVVITFEPHPLTVLRPELAPPRLTTASLKADLLESQGVDFLVNLAPVPEVLGLAAEQFWRILRDRVRLAHLVEGSSFRFGKGAAGNVARLQEWSADSNVKIHVAESVQVPLLNLQIVPVSSSVIRFLLAFGRAREAAICLGRPYILEGPVGKGFQRGRELGVPTANLKIADQLIPADGVYHGQCAVDGQTYSTAISIGTMPTFGENVRQVEAHLIGFDGDLYGRTLRVEFIDWLREQWKFPSIDGLKERIGRDLNAITGAARRDPSRAIASG